MHPDINLLVAGKWQIKSRIGKGSAGVVYSAVDVFSGEKVAVKFECLGGSQLKNERDIYQRLGYLNSSSRAVCGIPNVYFYGKHGCDYYAIVMDYLGKTLDTVVRDRGEFFDQKASSEIAIQALDILQYVHSRGVVHLDIAPRNLLRGRHEADALYLIDFGLAKAPKSHNWFEMGRMTDLRELGQALYYLRTGRFYVGRQSSSEKTPEFDEYFELLQMLQQKEVNYQSLRRIFEFLLDER